MRTNYRADERHVVRTLTSLEPSLLAEGGLASADGGENGTPITGIAAAWFRKVCGECHRQIEVRSEP